MDPAYLWTGQVLCHGPDGEPVPCRGTGQDAAFAPGLPWPDPRFAAEADTTADRLTGLVWTRSANPFGFPMTWPEALEAVAQANDQGTLGRGDWRMPNRREMRSLISHAERKPALPNGHPFKDVFLGWYWTSTTSAVNTAYAWYVHTEGGRMFYGRKDQYCLVWPVAGECRLPATGQDRCYGVDGGEIPCPGTGQDGEARFGAPWPEPRFQSQGEVVVDRLTGLAWSRKADLLPGPGHWAQALEAASRVEAARPEGYGPWRLPTINELESLVDARASSPALPEGHPFAGALDAYWSSTTSGFEPDWAMCLYLGKGAVGVGFKRDKGFGAWAVCSPGRGPEPGQGL